MTNDLKACFKTLSTPTCTNIITALLHEKIRSSHALTQHALTSVVACACNLAKNGSYKTDSDEDAGFKTESRLSDGDVEGLCPDVSNNI